DPEEGIRLGEGELDGLGIGRLDGLEQLELPGMNGRLLLVLDAVEVPLDIRGRARVAVVEGHALMEAKDVRAVALDLPLPRQLRLEVHTLAVGGGDAQGAVVDVVVDAEGRDEGRVVRIERVDILEAADLDGATPLDRLGF